MTTQPSSAPADPLPPVYDAVLDGAADCIERLGVEALKVEDIVRASGVSRATIYRYFGNRDAIIAALFSRTARPFEDDARAHMSGPGSFAERLEGTLVWAAVEHSRNPAPQAVLAHGVSTAAVTLFNALYREIFERVLRPAFAEAQATGEMPVDLDAGEALDWFVREILFLLSEPLADEAALRRRIRQYIIPVLCRPAALEGLAGADALRALSGRLDALDALVQSMKGDLRRMSVSPDR